MIRIFTFFLCLLSVCFAADAPTPYIYSDGRITIRPIVYEDADALVPIYSDAGSMKFFGAGKIYGADEVLDFVERWVEETKKEEPYRFDWTIVFEKSVVGLVGLFFNTPLEHPESELYYCLNPEYSGKGITTAAANLLMKHIPGPFQASVHPDNIPSVRVLEKLGFQKDPTRQGVPKFGSVRDFYLLSGL